MGIHFLVCIVRGSDFDFLEKGIIATICAITMGIAPFLGAYFSIVRSNYLESTDIEKPSFNGVLSSVVHVPQGFDFSCLKTEIAKKWVITFSDDTKKVLKFRERIIALRNWGAGMWIKLDNDTGNLYCCCFTMTGTQNVFAKKMLDEIKKCLEKYEQSEKSTPYNNVKD